MKKINILIISVALCAISCKKEQQVGPAVNSKITFGGGTTKAQPAFQSKVTFGGGIATVSR